MRAIKHLIIVPLIVLGALTLAACSQHKNATVTAEDMTIGKADAPVHVVEYASVACPGCAKFNNENWAQIKKDYIDTGKARWTVKEMLTHNPSWAAAGFLTARCLGPDKYFDAIDAMYRAQPEIDASGDIKGGLLKIAKSFGMSEKDFEACISDEKALAAMSDRIEQASRADKINSPPTFIINGKELQAEPNAANIGAAITAAAAKPAAG
jgi:protein-disulfide isomerase